MHRPPQIIVVAYGAEGLLRRCLDALGDGQHVVVVDNGRSDEAERIARAAGTTYVRSQTNGGFAAGVNAGLATRDAGRDVLLLNPDALIAQDEVRRLQECLHQRPRIAAVAPLLRRTDGEAERTSWPMPSVASAWLGALGLGSLTRRRFLNGAVLLLNGAAIDAVGGFDERYFLYAEEADWQLRALREGWTLDVVDDVTAFHVGAATSSDATRRTLLFHASAEKFIRKWHGQRGWALYRVGAIVAAARRWLLTRDRRQRRQQSELIAIYLRGPCRCFNSRYADA